MHEIFEALLHGVFGTSTIEWIAVVTGIASVWCSMKEHILVYPFDCKCFDLCIAFLNTLYTQIWGLWILFYYECIWMVSLEKYR